MRPSLLIVCCLLGAVTLHAGEMESDPVVAEVGDVVVLHSQIRCVEGVRGTDRCTSEEKDKLLGRVGTALIRLGAEISGIALTDEELSEIEAPSPLDQQASDEFVTAVRCLMTQALAIKRGETSEPDDCGQDEQSLQHMLDYYTVNDLERILAKDLMEEVEASRRQSKIDSALYQKVHELRGDAALSFWKDLYDARVRFPSETYRVRPAFAAGENSRDAVR